jgi:hypothetical protein
VGKVPKTSWALDELFNIFPELRVPTRPVRHCLEPLRGKGQFVRETATQRVFAAVTLDVTPGTECSIVIGDACVAAGTANEEMIVRAILRGILSATVDSQPPALGCRVECIEAIAEPMSVVSISVAASIAMQDSLRQPGWDPPDPTPDSVRATNIA